MARTTVLKLDRTAMSPVFEIESENSTILSCMFDTGANICVWCTGVAYFKFCFPSSKATEYKFLIGGFGEGVIEADAYIIPKLCIGDLEFKNFYVAVIESERFTWDFILGYTIFRKIDFAIKNRDTPLLELRYDRSTYCMNVKYNTVDGRGDIIDKPYVFAETNNIPRKDLERAFTSYIKSKKNKGK